jgi:GTP-binding protein
MLIDTAVIKIKAGRGGDGVVAFSKVKMALGPTGGSGGNGGDVYVEAVADLGALRKYRRVKVFNAEDGKKGRSAFRDGHRGAPLILLVPRGTTVTDLVTKRSRELSQVGERMLVAKGGLGGRGNFHFRSSTNTSPKGAEQGTAGESCTLNFELKLIADIGLVGLPNIGKSSFLNAITNAKSPVADYAFTTLEPHLGAYYGLVLADIPGLIEGASMGRGLGIKFLRHIERTRVLFHFIDAQSADPLTDYKVIRAELAAYNPVLLEKPEYIVISRIDNVSTGRIQEIEHLLAPLERDMIPISVFDEATLSGAKKILNSLGV